MSWMWIPYFAEVSGSLSWLFSILGMVVVCIVAFCMFFHQLDKNELWKYWKIIFVSIPLFTLAALFPSKETAFQMAGLGAAETVIKSDTANKAVELANEYLTKQLKQLKQENK